MSTKKETNAKKTTSKAKAPAKRPTAAQKLKLAQTELVELRKKTASLELEMETTKDDLKSATSMLSKAVKNANELHLKYTEEQVLRDQFFENVDELVDNYNKSNFIVKITRAFKVLKSLIRLFKYYKAVVKDEA
jgi:hypothetical protein